jgi:hypothetical protein
VRARLINIRNPEGFGCEPLSEFLTYIGVQINLVATPHRGLGLEHQRSHPTYGSIGSSILSQIATALSAEIPSLAT